MNEQQQQQQQDEQARTNATNSCVSADSINDDGNICQQLDNKAPIMDACYRKTKPSPSPSVSAVKVPKAQNTGSNISSISSDNEKAMLEKEEDEDEDTKVMKLWNLVHSSDDDNVDEREATGKTDDNRTIELRSKRDGTLSFQDFQSLVRKFISSEELSRNEMIELSLLMFALALCQYPNK